MTTTSYLPRPAVALGPALAGRPTRVRVRPAAADRTTQRLRRIRFARTLAAVAVRRALLPPGASRSRQRLLVCGSANLLTALGVRVQVVGGAVPWPRLGRVVVSDHTGWLGDLALTSAAPGTPVIDDATRSLPPGSIVCPVVLRYRTADGYLDRSALPRTPGEVAAARDLVIEVHRLPALPPARVPTPV